MTGEMVAAFGLGGMCAAAFILALCKSAGDADHWLEEHEPTDPCEADLTGGNRGSGAVDDLQSPLCSPFPPVKISLSRPRPGQLTNVFHSLNHRPR